MPSLQKGLRFLGLGEDLKKVSWRVFQRKMVGLIWVGSRWNFKMQRLQNHVERRAVVVFFAGKKEERDERE